MTFKALTLLLSWFSGQTAFSLVRSQQLGNSVRGHNPNVLQMLLPNGQPEKCCFKACNLSARAETATRPTQLQASFPQTKATDDKDSATTRSSLIC